MKLEIYYQWMVKVKKDGFELQKAPPELRSDKKLVLAAVQRNGGALQFVSRELLHSNDGNDIIVAALQQDGEALRYVPHDLQHKNLELVYTAVQQNGRAVRFVPESIQRDHSNSRDIVLAAVESTPDAIRFIIDENTKRDPEILIASGMFDRQNNKNDESSHDNDDVDDDGFVIQKKDPPNDSKPIKITLSTRFALNSDSSSDATNFTALLKKHEYLQRRNFKIYAPNAFDKKTCDPNWTNFDHPCRGTVDTCQLFDNNLLQKNGGRPSDQCCWRYSFRYQLLEARETGGFMIQLVEKEDWHSSEPPILGNGQQIERDMAQDLGMKIFHVYRPLRHGGYEAKFRPDHIDEVISVVKGWYDNGCNNDMSEWIIHPEDR